MYLYILFPFKLTNVAGTPPDFFLVFSAVADDEGCAAAPSAVPVVDAVGVLALDLGADSSVGG